MHQDRLEALFATLRIGHRGGRERDIAERRERAVRYEATVLIAAINEWL
ncbi:hypothetical protein [Streptomyces shenzhenensis]